METTAMKDEILRLRSEGLTISRIAAHLGMSRETVRATIARAEGRMPASLRHCPLCGGTMSRTSKSCWDCTHKEASRRRDPTPEEIRQRAEAIRDGWSDTEHERRFCGEAAVPVRFAEVLSGKYLNGGVM